MGVPRQNTKDFKSNQNDKDLTQKQRYRISTQNTIDLKSYTNNDKDLTHNISNKKMKSQFPVYAQNYIKQYICLLGLNDNFGHIHRYLDYENIKKGDLKKQEKFLQSLCFLIGKYGEAVKSGFFKDLSEEELTLDVFDNIEHIEMSLEEFLENYLVPCTEDDDEYEYDDCIYKLDKQKYENNVDKDYPGLRKLIDTLKLYNETIKYEKIYKYHKEINQPLSLNYSDSESEDEDEDVSDSESDNDDYLNREQLRDYLYIKEGVYSDSDEYDLESDSDSD